MAGRTITSWGQLFGEFQVSHGVTGEPPPPPPVPVATEDGEWLYRWSERRDEDDQQPNPWDTLNKWLVPANERQVDRVRVARLLRVDANDREVMQLASQIRRRRR